jgi:hypothetical protein
MLRKEHIDLILYGSKTDISQVSDIVAINRTDICARAAAMNVRHLHTKFEEPPTFTPNAALGQIIRPAIQESRDL